MSAAIPLCHSTGMANHHAAPPTRRGLLASTRRRRFCSVVGTVIETPVMADRSWNHPLWALPGESWHPPSLCQPPGSSRRPAWNLLTPNGRVLCQPLLDCQVPLVPWPALVKTSLRSAPQCYRVSASSDNKIFMAEARRSPPNGGHLRGKPPYLVVPRSIHPPNGIGGGGSDYSLRTPYNMGADLSTSRLPGCPRAASYPHHHFTSSRKAVPASRPTPAHRSQRPPRRSIAHFVQITPAATGA